MLLSHQDFEIFLKNGFLKFLKIIFGLCIELNFCQLISNKCIIQYHPSSFIYNVAKKLSITLKEKSVQKQEAINIHVDIIKDC